jgi:hypothetical protein
MPAPGVLHPTGIEGANQTIFVRRIALRPPISYFGRSRFKHSPPSVLSQFYESAARIKRDWWVVEELGDNQSLPAIAPGASSANIEDGTDETMKSNDVQRAP